MASGNRKRHECRHRNFGKYCHRCEFADTLEEMSKTGKQLIDHKKHKKPHKWTLEEMQEEARRLRAEDRK